MAYIKLFFADGTEVSPQGTFTNAIGKLDGWPVRYVDKIPRAQGG